MARLEYERDKENLQSLDLTNTYNIIDNYLDRALKEDQNIVQILDYLLMEEVKFKDKRAADIQVSVAAFPIKRL